MLFGSPIVQIGFAVIDHRLKLKASRGQGQVRIPLYRRRAAGYDVFLAVAFETRKLC